MPCQSSPDQSDLERQEEEDNHTTTRLACDRCREIEAKGGTVPKWARKWWTEHKRYDDARLAREAKFRAEQELRKQAIAKLTPEERSALGV